MDRRWQVELGTMPLICGMPLREYTSTRSQRMPGGITSIAYSPDGQTLAIGTSDDIVDLWDVIAGEYKGTLIGHEACSQ